MNTVRIKKSGNYPIAKFSGFNIIWEDQKCAAGDEFDENVIDTEFMTSEEFEIVEANFNS